MSKGGWRGGFLSWEAGPLPDSEALGGSAGGRAWRGGATWNLLKQVSLGAELVDLLYQAAPSPLCPRAPQTLTFYTRALGWFLRPPSNLRSPPCTPATSTTGGVPMSLRGCFPGVSGPSQALPPIPSARAATWDHLLERGAAVDGLVHSWGEEEKKPSYARGWC